jgi:uncharacterized sporulation protein YeaH/YhbH (DUF444 family)
MADTVVSASFIFVDRRKTGRGKSLPNREKLLKRIKDSIKNAKPEDIDAQGVKGSGTGHSKQLANPVKVARDALAEPTFMYASGTGEREVVLPGNDIWLKGDEFPVSGGGSGSGGSGSGNGPGEDGEDDFVINISRQEFYDVFFEDCELPDLEQTAEKELPEAVLKPAGFQKEGTPGQLSVIRSYRNSVGRRRALTFDDREELEVLQTRLDELMACQEGENELGKPWSDDTNAWCVEVKTITDRIAEIRTRIAAIPLFEKVDHRYRKTERVMVKSADAVLIMCMDVSGSMDEDRKRLARKMFAMQYAFIKRKYPNTDLVFIEHTDTANEVDEEEFFTSRRNGGTVISPAIALAHQIVKERYDPTQTNLYFSYAGDGDNWESDNKEVISEYEDRGFLSKLRHAVYIQVGEEFGNYGSMQGGQSRFWSVMTSIAMTSKKMHCVKVKEDSEVFAQFKKIYGKKAKKGT